MGIICQYEQKYSLAIVCFKKQLQYSWHLNHVEGEISAYESLSIQYYYLGDLDKCMYYHNRVQKGLREPFDSYERKTALETLESYMKEMRRKMNYHLQPDIYEGFEKN